MIFCYLILAKVCFSFSLGSVRVKGEHEVGWDMTNVSSNQCGNCYQNLNKQRVLRPNQKIRELLHYRFRPFLKKILGYKKRRHSNDTTPLTISYSIIFRGKKYEAILGSNIFCTGFNFKDFSGLILIRIQLELQLINCRHPL